MKALTHTDHRKFALIEAEKIDTTPRITHRFRPEDIGKAYRIIRSKPDGGIQFAMVP